MSWFKREKKQPEGEGFNVREALDDPEYVKALAKYQKDKAKRELDLNNPKDIEIAAGLKQNLEKKAETSTQLKDLYTNEIRDRIGLDLPPEAFQDVEAHLAELTENNPGKLQELLDKMEKFNEFKGQISELEEVLNKDLGALQEKEAVLLRTGETEGRFARFGLGQLTKNAQLARQQAKDRFNVEVENIQSSLAEVGKEIGSVEEAMAKRDKIMEQFIDLRTELLRSLKGSKKIFTSASELAKKKFDELKDPSNPLESLMEAQAFLDKIENRTLKEEVSEGSVSVGVGIREQTDLNIAIEKKVQASIIQGMKNLPPESQRISVVESTLKTLLKMEDDKQLQFGSAKGQKAHKFVGNVLKGVLNRSDVSNETKLLIKRVAITYEFPV